MRRSEPLARLSRARSSTPSPGGPSSCRTSSAPSRSSRSSRSQTRFPIARTRRSCRSACSASVDTASRMYVSGTPQVTWPPRSRRSEPLRTSSIVALRPRRRVGRRAPAGQAAPLRADCRRDGAQPPRAHSAHAPRAGRTRSRVPAPGPAPSRPPRHPSHRVARPPLRRGSGVRASGRAPAHGDTAGVLLGEQSLDDRRGHPHPRAIGRVVRERCRHAPVELGEEGGRAVEVIGADLDQLVRCTLFEPGSEDLMVLSPLDLRHPAVPNVVDQQVLELASRRGRRRSTNDPPFSMRSRCKSRLEQHRHVEIRREALDGTAPEDPSDDRGPLQHSASAPARGDRSSRRTIIACTVSGIPPSCVAVGASASSSMSAVSSRNSGLPSAFSSSTRRSSGR